MQFEDAGTKIIAAAAAAAAVVVHARPLRHGLPTGGGGGVPSRLLPRTLAIISKTENLCGLALRRLSPHDAPGLGKRHVQRVGRTRQLDLGVQLVDDQRCLALALDAHERAPCGLPAASVFSQNVHHFDAVRGDDRGAEQVANFGLAVRVRQHPKEELAGVGTHGETGHAEPFGLAAGEGDLQRPGPARERHLIMQRGDATLGVVVFAKGDKGAALGGAAMGDDVHPAHTAVRLEERPQVGLRGGERDAPDEELARVALRRRNEVLRGGGRGGGGRGHREVEGEEGREQGQEGGGAHDPRDGRCRRDCGPR